MIIEYVRIPKDSVRIARYSLIEATYKNLTELCANLMYLKEYFLKMKMFEIYSMYSETFKQVKEDMNMLFDEFERRAKFN
jgi:hypothetical protein